MRLTAGAIDQCTLLYRAYHIFCVFVCTIVRTHFNHTFLLGFLSLSLFIHSFHHLIHSPNRALTIFNLPHLVFTQQSSSLLNQTRSNSEVIRHPSHQYMLVSSSMSATRRTLSGPVVLPRVHALSLSLSLSFSIVNQLVPSPSPSTVISPRRRRRCCIELLRLRRRYYCS